MNFTQDQLTEKFKRYANFIKDEILDHCEDKRGENNSMFKTYIIAFEMLPAQKIIELLTFGAERSQQELTADSLQKRYVKMFNIKLDELSDDIRYKFYCWSEFIVDVATQTKK